MISPEGPARPAAEPWAYFLTFACYGTRKHGDERGSVDHRHNGVQTPYLAENPDRLRWVENRMERSAAILDAKERDVVLASIQSVLQHEGWTLYAAHVRSTHVHIVVHAGIKPEAVTGKFKAYASRALNQMFGNQPNRWSRHGSTVYLWNAQQLSAVIDYVVHGQGAAMSCYLNPCPWQPPAREQETRS